MNLDPSFRLDHETHTYQLRGEIIPSLHQILRQWSEPAYQGIVDEEVLERAMLKGTEVHTLTELYDTGMIGREDGGELGEYLEAWAQFREDANFVPSLIETPLYHPQPGNHYGCTPDRFGLSGDKPTVVDIKTGGKAIWHPLQLAGQVEALDSWGVCDRNTVQRINVYLCPKWKNAPYHVEQCEDPRDFRVFNASVTIYIDGRHYRR